MCSCCGGDTEQMCHSIDQNRRDLQNLHWGFDAEMPAEVHGKNQVKWQFSSLLSFNYQNSTVAGNQKVLRDRQKKRSEQAVNPGSPRSRLLTAFHP